MDWQIVSNCILTIYKGLPVTIFLILFSAPLSLLLSMIFTAMYRSDCKLLIVCAKFYCAFFRGTPLLVQLYLAYNGAARLSFIQENSFFWWFFSDGFRCAVLVISVNSAAYITEIMRGGFAALPKEMGAAARALGMPSFLVFRAIELPLAIRLALPAYSNELLLLVKGTSLASTIAVAEMMSYTKRLFNSSLAPLEVFLVCGCFYLILNFILTLCLRYVEGRYMRYQNKRV